MQPRPRRRRRLVLSGIVAALALLLGGTAVVQLRAETTWRSMVAEEQRLQASWDARSHQRTVLWGETTAGNAFAHYERATQTARQLLGKDNDELVRALRLTDEEVATRTTALRARWQPVVKALQAGAHAADVAPPAWTVGPETTAFVHLLDCRWAANATVFAARALRHEGHGVAAVQHTLDVAAFGADLMRRGMLINQMIGTAILAIGCGEAWPEAALARLDRAALELLAKGLQRLDAQLPATLDQRGELLFFARSLRQVPLDPAWVPDPAPWRYGFSARWMLADAFTRTATTAHDLERAGELAWPQRQALLELELGALAGSGNPVLKLMAPNLVAAEANVRHVLATLRLLRMAVDLHLGLDVPPLRDPLADGPIRVTRTDDGLRLHCAGADERASLARTVRR